MAWADLGIQGVEKDLKTPYLDALVAAGQKDFDVKLSNANSGEQDFHPIGETKWSHAPCSRRVMFVDGGAQKTTPQIAGIEDFRRTAEKPELPVPSVTRPDDISLNVAPVLDFSHVAQWPFLMMMKNLTKTNMIHPIKVVLISALSALLSSYSIAQEQPPIEDGFTPIFNGKDWEGWHLKIRSGDAEMAAKVFAIDDGIVHVFKDLPDTLELNTGTNSTHGLFYTNKKYSRFILRFDYKWGKKTYNNFEQFQYDAGCYYHVVDDKIWPVGIEYQIRYDHLKQKNHTGDFWARDLQWYAGPDGTFLLPQDGGTAQPPRKGEHPVLASAKHHALDDQWNQCEVIVMADEYAIHKLNGKVVNMATKLPHSEGIIGLQSETAEIFYRNIRIKEFSESVIMEQFIK